MNFIIRPSTGGQRLFSKTIFGNVLRKKRIFKTDLSKKLILNVKSQVTGVFTGAYDSYNKYIKWFSLLNLRLVLEENNIRRKVFFRLKKGSKDFFSDKFFPKPAYVPSKF